MSAQYTQETQNKRIEHNNIIYSINDEKNVASIDECKLNLPTIVIPQSIKHESKEYCIICILEKSFHYSKF